jgi:phosphoribosylanthranilate isomerase
MWVKICGNTNLEDAQVAAALGADAVGFVFAPSLRQVTSRTVAEIASHLPPQVERVGVFPSDSAEEIASAAASAGLHAVQLHGGVDLALVDRLRELLDGQVRIIQTVHWKVDAANSNAAEVNRQLREIDAHGVVDRVLVDSKVGQVTGGTGTAFDWEAARGVLAEGIGRLRLIVAGGLQPENVAQAIVRLNAWGVDVSSGVESSPGRKDHAKIAAFIKAARG